MGPLPDSAARPIVLVSLLGFAFGGCGSSDNKRRARPAVGDSGGPDDAAVGGRGGSAPTLGSGGSTGGPGGMDGGPAAGDAMADVSSDGASVGAEAGLVDAGDGAALDASDRTLCGIRLGGNVDCNHGALLFDGDDIVVVPGTSRIDLQSGFTVQAWLKTTCKTAAESGIVGKHQCASNNGWFLGLMTQRASADESGQIYVGDDSTRAIGSTTLSDGQWHHLSGTYDGVTARLYVDGALVASTAADYSQTNALDIAFGSASSGPCATFYQGALDEITIWDFERDATQIAADMSAAPSPSAAGLVAYYNFDRDGCGQIISDDSLNGFPARLGSTTGVDSDDPTWIGDGPFPAGGVTSTFDLASDWSDARNPNGPWQLRAGTTVVASSQNDYGATGQSAWASGPSGQPGHIPAFLRIAVDPTGPLGLPDTQIGDVVVHSQDDTNGAGLGQARIVWVSPAAGELDVTGNTWMARAIGRSNDWTLSIGGTVVASGSLFDGDPYDRASPFEFADGATASLTAVPVSEDSEVIFDLVKTDPSFGDFSGVNLGVTLRH